jgi:hypothetical protein
MRNWSLLKLAGPKMLLPPFFVESQAKVLPLPEKDGNYCITRTIKKEMKSEFSLILST